ncbi:MAG TPA: hypothetical protein VE967_07575 [Gemmatimonadaceae bacterium]|nr:hypothetical protein [Gemmatimonadaceae bacterium]
MPRTITMLEFRRDAAAILRRIARGERLVLSHRGKAVARLEPVDTSPGADPDTDPFLTVERRATPSPKGRTKHRDIDRHVYGGA